MSIMSHEKIIEKHNPGDIKQAARRRDGVLAANYYGFACDWCVAKGRGKKSFRDRNSSETHFIRLFSSNGSEIRLCLHCSDKLQASCWSRLFCCA